MVCGVTAWKISEKDHGNGPKNGCKMSIRF